MNSNATPTPKKKSRFLTTMSPFQKTRAKQWQSWVKGGPYSMWKIHDNRLRDTAQSPAARKLFEILEATFGKDARNLPHSLQQAQPFVLCRDFCKSHWVHPNDPPGELYRFQLGPRAWTRPIYVFDGYKISDRLPQYERDAELLAMQLKKAFWDSAALALIEPILTEARASTENKIELTLSWQDGERYCVIHDRESQRAIAFLWTVDGLELLGEAHPGRLNRSEYTPLSQTYDRPILSLDEGTKNFKPASRAGQMEEFTAAIQWRYATHLDNRFDGLLLETCDRLRTIEGTIGMAFAGHRFNDAVGDDSWLAVRHENFAWENGAYFQSSATSLREAPTEIHGMIGVLVHLKTCGIGAAFSECYGYAVEALDVIGLFRQSGKHYFACCNSQGDCGPVYEIDSETGRTTLCGFTDRFDWNFNSGSRAGGIVPQSDVLQIMTLAEVIHRVGTNDTPYDAGPPHGMDVPWMAYLPCDPDE